VLPSGFHRIRHYGLFASPRRAANIERVRGLLAAAPATLSAQRATAADPSHVDPPTASPACPRCGGRMRVVEVFARGAQPRAFTAEPAGNDTS